MRQALSFLACEVFGSDFCNLLSGLPFHILRAFTWALTPSAVLSAIARSSPQPASHTHRPVPAGLPNGDHLVCSNKRLRPFPESKSPQGEVRLGLFVGFHETGCRPESHTQAESLDEESISKHQIKQPRIGILSIGKTDWRLIFYIS